MNGRHHNNKNNYSNHNILPSPRILEEYEKTSPGSVNKLLEMASKEQHHRHSWQDRYLKAHNGIYRLGQLFGFAYNILLLYIIYKLVRNGNINIALKFFAINTVLIALAIIVTFTERKITTRKPPRRNVDNNNKNHSRRHRNNNPNHNHRPNRGDRGGE